MSRNVELKARVNKLTKIRETLAERQLKPQQELSQTDTYFRVRLGRLKLRECETVGSELIYYQRPNLAESKDCRYWRQPIANSALTKRLLSENCGVDAVVRKQREVYLLDSTRIHLDRVEGLGEYVEFEAVLGDGELSDEDYHAGHEILKSLMMQLQIAENQLERQSYRELIRDPSAQTEG